MGAAYEKIEAFTEEDCEVQEGMITAGTHRLLRFSTESRNIGGADLVLAPPDADLLRAVGAVPLRCQRGVRGRARRPGPGRTLVARRESSSARA